MSNNLLLGNIYELHPTQMTQFAKGSFHLKKRQNKMELLQSQAPVDWKLSGSSASARHGTSDIGH